jgi:hypothetical protein
VNKNAILGSTPAQLESFFYCKFLEYGMHDREASTDAEIAARFATARVYRMPSTSNHITWALIERFERIEQYPASYRGALAQEIGESMYMLTSLFPNHIVNEHRTLSLEYYDKYGASALEFAAQQMHSADARALRMLSRHYPERRLSLTHAFRHISDGETVENYLASIAKEKPPAN